MKGLTQRRDVRLAQNRRNQIIAVLFRFLGFFFLIGLFGLAEFAPDTLAEQRSPWVGVWTGKSNQSAVSTTLYLEDDHSFTWLRGDKRLISGDYELHPSKIKLKFRGTPEEHLTYDYVLKADALTLRQGNYEYRLRKAQTSR